MKRILLIKLTSLGDLIHALPAISDATRAYPEIEFDWMIDRSFQEVALWHPSVKRLYITDHRHWGANRQTYREIRDLVSGLRKSEYDLVIDGQGNFKTALLSLAAKGPSAGFDKNSVREWIAHIAYQRTYAASKKAHAIERLRRLFSSALQYPMPLSPPNFGIQIDRLTPPSIELPSSYFVFVHNASWDSKLWPESHWIELIKKTIDSGFTILLPWGNQKELARAKRLAIFPHVQILPKMNLSEIGYVLTKAQGCVCMDTGLSHLASALQVPSITLYGSTHSGLIGASGGIHLQSDLGCSPCQKKTCPLIGQTNLCLQKISPESVYKELLRQANFRYL